jgi:hypothetical protein
MGGVLLSRSAANPMKRRGNTFKSRTIRVNRRRSRELAPAAGQAGLCLIECELNGEPGRFIPGLIQVSVVYLKCLT